MNTTDLRKSLLGSVLLITVLGAATGLGALMGCTPQAEKDLVAAFENPPQEARPVMIWQWMDGWVTGWGYRLNSPKYSWSRLTCSSSALWSSMDFWLVYHT